MEKQLQFSDEQKRTCAIGVKANLDYKLMLYDKYNSSQNAKVGNISPEWGGLPAVQVRLIYRKDYVIKNTGPIGLGRLQAEQCPGAHDCMPAGRRSRIEWCNCGNVIE